MFTASLPCKNGSTITTWQEWEKMGGPSGSMSKEWTSIMVNSIEKLNPFCTFAFKYKWVKKHPSRKASDCCFRAHAMCTFGNCPMRCTLKLDSYNPLTPPDSLQLNLSFSTTIISHSKDERRARFIKGETRQMLMDELKRCKPSSLQHQRLLQLPPEAFKSGRRDGVGVSSSVLQVSSEALHRDDLDDNICILLLLLREKHLQEEKEATQVLPNSLLPGYIQRVHAFPFSVTCYTEAGIRLFHSMAKTSVLYFDATGTLTTLPTSSSSTLLYYSMVISHPLPKNPPVAVAELISSEHSVLAISHFLDAIRRAEGVLYGSGNLVKPRVIVIDRSIVLLMSFLKVFNLETIESYLHRCFRVVTGCSVTEDDIKTLL